MDKEQDILKGQKADLLLRDPIFQEALEKVETTIIQGIKQSQFDETDKREEGYRMLRALESLTGEIHRFVKKARAAQHEAEEKARHVPRLADIKE